MSPDARREPGTGLSSDQHTDHGNGSRQQDTAHLLTVDSSEVLILEDEYAELLADGRGWHGPSWARRWVDAEKAGEELFETMGRSWCARLLVALSRNLEDGGR